MISKKLNMAAAIVAVAAIAGFATGCGDDSTPNTDQLKQEANKAIDQAHDQAEKALEDSGATGETKKALEDAKKQIEEAQKKANDEVDKALGN